MEETFLSIGGLSFQICHPAECRRDPSFDPFLAAMPADITVEYREDPQVESKRIHISEDGTQVTVWYNPSIADQFTALRGCLIHLPVEELLARHQRFFLHAAFVSSPWGGLLFSGDSGVGKSTQAELWRIHRGSTVINGDRAIVEKSVPWRAYGSLYAGSSGCYVNRSEPVAAIILLEQGKENRITRPTPAEAFRFLLMQCALENQNADTVNRQCDLLAELIADVPVYRLCCTPDVRAVDALAEVLEKGRMT